MPARIASRPSRAGSRGPTIRRLREGGGAAHDSGGVEVFGQTAEKTTATLRHRGAVVANRAKSDFSVYVN